MITIQESATRNIGDVSQLSKNTLMLSNNQHISDVRKGLSFFSNMINESARLHDHDKVDDVDTFHSDFISGFKNTNWWDNHVLTSRHHLTQDAGVRDDVNLVDVIEMVTDCVMSGLARNGVVYPVEIDVNILQQAFSNTVELLKNNVRVVDSATATSIERARHNGEPCINSECCYHIDDYELQNCNGMLDCGDPTVSICNEYLINMNKVVYAAIKLPDGSIIKGSKNQRHCHIMENYSGYIQSSSIFGFLDESGVFLTRSCAAKRAFICGQIPDSVCPQTIFSDDLW